MLQAKLLALVQPKYYINDFTIINLINTKMNIKENSTEYILALCACVCVRAHMCVPVSCVCLCVCMCICMCVHGEREIERIFFKCFYYSSCCPYNLSWWLYLFNIRAALIKANFGCCTAQLFFFQCIIANIWNLFKPTTHLRNMGQVKQNIW